MFHQSMKHRISVFCACKIYIISLLVYYPVINVEKYSTAACVFYISLMLSNARRAAVLGTLRYHDGTGRLPEVNLLNRACAEEL